MGSQVRKSWAEGELVTVVDLRGRPIEQHEAESFEKGVLMLELGGRWKLIGGKWRVMRGSPRHLVGSDTIRPARVGDGDACARQRSLLRIYCASSGEWARLSTDALFRIAATLDELKHAKRVVRKPGA